MPKVPHPPPLFLSLSQIAPPLKVRDPSTTNLFFFTNPPPFNDRERPNDRLVTDEPVEVEDFRKFTHHFEGDLQNIPRIKKEKSKTSQFYNLFGLGNSRMFTNYTHKSPRTLPPITTISASLLVANLRLRHRFFTNFSIPAVQVVCRNRSKRRSRSR